eukprot:9501607-Pyramimonas_sp.AAC.1
MFFHALSIRSALNRNSPRSPASSELLSKLENTAACVARRSVLVISATVPLGTELACASKLPPGGPRGAPHITRYPQPRHGGGMGQRP